MLADVDRGGRGVARKSSTSSLEPTIRQAFNDGQLKVNRTAQCGRSSRVRPAVNDFERVNGR